MDLELAKLQIEERHRESDARELARLARSNRSHESKSLLRFVVRARNRVVARTA
jgi:hypothetical protein